MFDFSWDDHNTQEKNGKNGYAKVWGVNKVHDCLCENGKYNKYTRNRFNSKINWSTIQ